MNKSMPTVIESLKNKNNLKFIFIGGKGGVGKTTSSCALSIALSDIKQKVLLISTDPAHNISDVFQQKFSAEPTLVNGTNNLFALELDPKIQLTKLFKLGEDNDLFSKINDFISSFPGLDELFCLANTMDYLKEQDFELIVFDTAPTGHTLKMLEFPQNFSETFKNIEGVLSKISMLLDTSNSIMSQVDKFKGKIEEILNIFKDNEQTTFVGVCIPSYLSICETERLVQELMRFDIDINNIIVNQINFPEDNCENCIAKYKIQKKYIDQIIELYDDFSLAFCNMLDFEVKGIDKLRLYIKELEEHKDIPEIN